MELCTTNLLATFRLSSSVSSADTFSAGEGYATRVIVIMCFFAHTREKGIL